MICTISTHKAERKGYSRCDDAGLSGAGSPNHRRETLFIKDGKIHNDRSADLLPPPASRGDAIDLSKRRGIRLRSGASSGRAFRLHRVASSRAPRREVRPSPRSRIWKFTPGKSCEQLINDYNPLGDRRRAKEGGGGVGGAFHYRTTNHADPYRIRRPRLRRRPSALAVRTRRSLSLGNFSNFSVSGSTAGIAFAMKSVTQTCPSRRHRPSSSRSCSWQRQVFQILAPS